jgi:cobalt-precorrin-7 (C5)-methyltransferase
VLYVVGVGPGDPEYLTVKALKALERCRAVAGWPSVLGRLPLEGKEVVALSYQNQEAELKRLAALSLSADVCLAVHGDPAVSDWELMERVRALGVPLEIISGVSSVNVALARAGLDLARVVVVSQHAREPQPLPPPECSRDLVVIPPPDVEAVRRVALELRSRGCDVWLMEDLTLPTESVRRVEGLGDTRPASSLVILVGKCAHALRQRAEGR